jgi:hypothetical protein
MGYFSHSDRHLAGIHIHDADGSLSIDGARVALILLPPADQQT